MHFVFKHICKSEKPGQWVKPVYTIWDIIKAAPKSPLALLKLLNKAFEIAFEFGENWQFSIAVYFLALLLFALKPRQIYNRL